MAEYTDEQIEEIKKQIRQEIESTYKSELDRALEGIEKLKQTNADMKQEKVEALKKAEQEKIDALREKGEEAEAAKLELERTQREIESVKLENETMRNENLSKELAVAHSEVLNMLHKKDPAMSVFAKSLVSANFEDGKIKRSYKDINGNVVADSLDGFKSWAEKDSDMQAYLAGSKASGTDTNTVNPVNDQVNKSSPSVKNWY